MRMTGRLTIAVAPLALSLASPAFAQSGGEAAADVEVTAILMASPNPLTVTSIENISFGEVSIPYAAATTCNYRLHAAANRMEVTRNNDATSTNLDLLRTGCTIGGVPHSFGRITMSCQPQSFLGARLSFVPSGLPGISVDFGNPENPNNEVVVWTNAFIPDQCSAAGTIAVRLGGVLRVTSMAVANAAPANIGTLQVALHYR